MDFRPDSLDDFDWSGQGPVTPTSAPAPSSQELLTPEEPAPPPASAPATQRRSSDYHDQEPGTDLLPQAYREGAKNIYKRRGGHQAFAPDSIDDYDWSGGKPAVSGEPAYDPKDDWAITRGFKVAADQGTQAITAVGDMTRIKSLSPDAQIAEMLKIGRQTDDPAAPKLAVEGFSDIGSFSEGMSWLGESFGQMFGSMWAAGTTGGAAGAATGAAVGGGLGAAAGGVGALPGALSGAVTGGVWGTRGAYLAMGIGGTFRDLLQDVDVQKGLENGTITPGEIYNWAVLGGAAVGALDMLPAERLLKSGLGKTLKPDAVKQTIRKAALKGALKTGAEEGATEGLQGAISEFAQAAVGGNWDVANRVFSVIDQGLAGAVGGAGPGSLGGIAENRHLPAAPDTANPPAPAGERAPLPVPDPGLTGPQTGTGQRPTPPVGTGTVGDATVTEVADGAVEGDIAASLDIDEEEEGEYAAPARAARTAPLGEQPPPVDSDVAAALTTEDAAQPAAPGPAPQRRRQPPPGQPPAIESPEPPTPEATATPQVAPGGEPPAAGAPQVLNEAPVSAALTEAPPETRSGIAPWQPRDWTPEQLAGARAQADRAGLTAIIADAPDEVTADQIYEQLRRPLAGMGMPRSFGIEFIQRVRASLAQEAPPAEAAAPVEEQIAAPVEEAAPAAPASADAVAAAHKRRTRAVQAYNAAATANDQAGMAAAHEEFMDAMVELGRVDREAFDHYASLANNRDFRDELERRLAAAPAAEVVRGPPPEPPAAAPPSAEAPTPPAAPAPAPVSPRADPRWQRPLRRYAEALGPAYLEREVEANRIERQLQREDAGTQAQRLKAEKLEAERVALRRPNIEVVDDARHRLNQLAGNRARYSYFWELLHPELQAILGQRFEPANRFAEAAAPQRATVERGEPEVVRLKLPELKRAPARPAPPSAAKPRTVTRKRRVTPAIVATMRARNVTEAEAVEEVKAPGKPGFTLPTHLQIEMIGARDKAAKRLIDKVTQAQPAGTKPHKIDQAVWQALPRKFKTDEYLEQLTRERLAEAARRPVAEARAGVSKEQAAAARSRSQLLGLLNQARANNQTVTVRDPKTFRKLGAVTGIGPDGTVIFGRRTADVDALFDKYAVDIEGVAETEALAELPVTSTTLRQPSAERGVVAGRPPAQRPPTTGGFKTTEQLKQEEPAKPAPTPEERREKFRQLGAKQAPIERRTVWKNRELIEAEAERAKEERKTAYEERAKEKAPLRDTAKKPGRTSWLRREIARRLLETSTLIHEPTTLPTGAPGIAQPILTAEEIAAKAVAGMRPGKKAPGQLAERARSTPTGEGEMFGPQPMDQIETTFERALQLLAERVREGRAKARELSDLALDTAQELWEARVEAGEEDTGKRGGKVHGLDAVTMAAEGYTATFRAAYRAYYGTADPAAQTTPVAQPDKATDPVKAIEWEMGRVQEMISKNSAGTGRTENRKAIKSDKAYFAKLKDQRVAAQQKVDRAKARLQASGAQMFERMKAKYEETIEKLVADKSLDVVEAEEIHSDFLDAQQAAKRTRRAKVTDTIIRRHMKAMPPPRDYSDADLKRHHDPRVSVALSIRDWANKFIDAIDADLKAKKGGYSFPRKASREHNTVLENLAQFIRSRLNRVSEAEEKAKVTGERENRYQRGQTLMDAWLAAAMVHEYLIKPKPRGVEEHHHFLAQREAIFEFYAIILDASKTGETVGGAREKSYATERKAEQEHQQMAQEVEGDKRGVMTMDQVIRESESTTAFADLFRQAREQGMTLGDIQVAGAAAPAEALLSRADQRKLRSLRAGEATTEAAPATTDYDGIIAKHGGPTKTLTGSEALNQLAKHWGAGDTKGIRGRLRSALMASLHSLVGDVEVNLVPAGAIDELSGTRSAGFYSQAAHRIFLRDDMAAKETGQHLVHEMIHAATSYAIHHNLRGTREILEDIRFRARRMIRQGQDEVIDYYLSDDFEFLTGAMESSDFQHILDGLKLDVESRADLRALARGRRTTSLWDYVMAMFENALGVFTPAGVPQSYMDGVVRLYGKLAMSTGEQETDIAQRGVRRFMHDDNALLNAPFNFQSVSSTIDRLTGGRAIDWKARRRWLYQHYIAPTENMLADFTERHFGGDWDNPFTNFTHDALLEHKRKVEDEMRQGLDQDVGIRRWINVNPMQRKDQALRAINTMLESSLDHVDPRKALADNVWIRDDAFHPTKKKRKKPTLKHEASTYQREVYDKRKAEWDSYPEELKKLLSDRADYMQEQMKKFDYAMLDFKLELLERKENSPLVLPAGMTRAEAADQIYKGAVSDTLEKALGKNMETIEASVGRLADRHGLYWPVSRFGDYFITGRRKIQLPSTTHGSVTLDQKTLDERDRHVFIFDDVRDARAYMEKMGETHDERVLKLQRRWVNPITGLKVDHDDHGTINGKTWQAEERLLLEVQHRFMMMGEDLKTLQDFRDSELARSDHDYHFITEPRTMDGTTYPDRTMIPSQLSAMLRDIDSMSGPSDHEKALLRSMATQTFIRTQTGSRLSKRMLKRQAVAGYETDRLDYLLASLHNNNEMMSRHIVNRERLVKVEESREEANNFVAAAAGDPRALAKLPQKWQTLLNRSYGKYGGGRAAQLKNDWDELQHRYNDTILPTGGKFRGENALNAFKSIVAMSYLATPMYNAVNAMGYRLQSQPRLVAEMGVGAQNRYEGKANEIISTMGNAWAGYTEALAEGKEMLKWRPGHFPVFRQQRNLLKEVSDSIRTQSARIGPNAEHILDMIDRMRLRNHIGQAGLDQANMRLDLTTPGAMQTFYRGVEQNMRVFRAMNEGIELNNRLKPAMQRLEFYLDRGMSPNNAIEKAINETVQDQVGYSQENWPTPMNIPVVREIMMFKKFPIQQTINFYRAIHRAFRGDLGPAEKKVARLQILGMTAALVLVGGAMGLPPWEPIRMLLYLFNALGIPVPANWNISKANIEEGLNSILPDRVAESAMYGLPRLFGLDLSGRVALDTTLFFQQPKEMTKDSWASAMGYLVGGAPFATVVNTVAATSNYLKGDQPLSKTLGQLPAPKMLQDIFKSYDAYTNGPTTPTGLKTGPAPGIITAIGQSMGVRTRAQARPFEAGSALQQARKKELSAGKGSLVRRVLNDGLTAANYDRIRKWNRSVSDPKMRIKIKDISAARKRRGRTEREMQQQNLEAM